jgi:hypothetical protein
VSGGTDSPENVGFRHCLGSDSQLCPRKDVRWRATGFAGALRRFLWSLSRRATTALPVRYRCLEGCRVDRYQWWTLRRQAGHVSPSPEQDGAGRSHAARARRGRASLPIITGLLSLQPEHNQH